MMPCRHFLLISMCWLRYGQGVIIGKKERQLGLDLTFVCFEPLTRSQDLQAKRLLVIDQLSVLPQTLYPKKPPFNSINSIIQLCTRIHLQRRLWQPRSR
jgi:hypothetical protein